VSINSSQLRVQGISVPRFLYGTAWKDQRTQELTELALRAGFVGIDTANQRKHYFEAGVGAAVRTALDSGRITRAELFLQTKFTFLDSQDKRLPYDPKAKVPEQVAQSFKSSLEHLQTDYIDAYVLHGPSRNVGLARADFEAWSAMEAVQRTGKTKLLGISNVTLEQLETLFTKAEVKPAFVQNRCYARTGWDREVRAFCRANGLIYQGFSLLTANSRELASPAFREIAERLQRSATDLVFGFALQVGMLPLTGTSNFEHMQADLACLNFELEAPDVRAIERISQR
jgi:diketogulonate reductase-like aldo/keto reductase